ncbi:MAG: LysM peptidoglycan-binding domain-containing protein [Nitrospirae bacterium]|nr:LysM peptidoglycan-binding domain-containing protein [Nitrospirota bacterium]MBI4838830.1 LysM peptidoglycan-binding domain-containing protein [Nitrospirota bacterium]
MKLFKTFMNYSGISLVIFLMFFTGSSFAENYKIKKGDSLYGISKKYKVPVDEIKEINGLQSNNLKIGSIIHLPPKKSNTASLEKSPAAAENRSLDGDDVETYIVKKGDTLIEIAQDYNITVKEIQWLNKLKKTAIKAGQKLLLPVEKNDNQTEITAVQEVEITQDYGISNDTEAFSWEGAEHIGTNLEFLDRKERLILFAKKFLDIPYRFGGTSMLGIDCSAFVQKVFDFFNVPLPRTAREQFYIGNRVDKDDLTVGDVVFFRTYAKFPSHVGIYMGDNLFIHASSKDKKVKINSLDEPYYFKRFLGAKRLIEPQAIESDPETEEDSAR